MNIRQMSSSLKSVLFFWWSQICWKRSPESAYSIMILHFVVKTMLILLLYLSPFNPRELSLTIVIERRHQWMLPCRRQCLGAGSMRGFGPRWVRSPSPYPKVSASSLSGEHIIHDQLYASHDTHYCTHPHLHHEHGWLTRHGLKRWLTKSLDDLEIDQRH